MLSNLKIYTLIYFSLTLNFCLAQSNTFDLKVDQLIKGMNIEEDKNSGIKNIFIGGKIIEENNRFYIKESRDIECQLVSDYKIDNSRYAKEFNLSQSAFKMFTQKITYFSCKTTIFNKDNYVVINALKNVKVNNEYTVFIIVTKVDGLDAETINYAMEAKWGKSVKEIRTDPKTNREMCLEVAPYELLGERELNRCIRKLNEKPIIRIINPTDSKILLYETKNSVAEVTHTARFSQIIIQSKKADLIVESISEVYRNYDNELKINRQKNLSKDF